MSALTPAGRGWVASPATAATTRACTRRSSLRSSLAAARSTWTCGPGWSPTELVAQLGQRNRSLASVDAGQGFSGSGDVRGVLGSFDRFGYLGGDHGSEALPTAGDVGDASGLVGAGNHIRQGVAGVGDREFDGGLTQQIQRTTRTSRTGLLVSPPISGQRHRRRPQPRYRTPVRAVTGPERRAGRRSAGARRASRRPRGTPPDRPGASAGPTSGGTTSWRDRAAP